MNAPSIPLLYDRWCQYQKHHPEWWTLSLAAGAWFFFITTKLYNIALNADVSSFWIGHAAPHPDSKLHSLLNSGFLDACVSWAFHWSLMIAAMMFPLLIGQIRTVTIRSFGFRRDRAISFFLCGYTSLWLFYGLVIAAILQLQHTLLPVVSTFLIPLGFLIAACWQLTEQKSQSIVACHFTMPLAPSGYRADFDCFRYGFRIAASCCMSCWALMFISVTTHHAIWAMLMVSVISWLERFLRNPRQLWFFIVLFAVGSVYSLIVFWSDRVSLNG